VDHPHHGPPPVEACPPAARWLELAERLTVCGRLIRSVISPLTDRRGVSDSLLSVLLVCRCAPSEGLAQNHIAAALAISPAGVSIQVEQLRAQGLLRGRRAASDRRRQLWRLTAAGVTLLEGVLADLADWSARMDASLGPHLAREMTALSERLQEAFGRDGAQGTPCGRPLRPFDPPEQNAGEPLPGTPAAATPGRARRRRAG
jgi:DNA-binding MarR family transcriptional regulator